MDTRFAAGPEPVAGACSAFLQYRMTADADPGMLPRVLQVLAKRSLVPEVFRSERRPGDDGLSVELRIPAVETTKARHIAACLRETVGVRTVLGPIPLDAP